MKRRREREEKRKKKKHSTIEKENVFNLILPTP